MDEQLFSKSALDAAPAVFEHACQVRFQDVDAAGVVFFPRILELFHDGYVAFMDAQGEPLSKALADRTWAAPLTQSRAEFLRPLRFGDKLKACLVRARFDGSDLWLGHKLVGEDGKLRAVGLTVHAFIDPSTFKRAPLPPQMPRVFAPLLDK
ncbi:MAG: acyl-CoA thioesterase [Deltaproteobacteria bacterium]|nr:acyl-CoA thioesterase [Deltaproteobacteria bacterium]